MRPLFFDVYFVMGAFHRRVNLKEKRKWVKNHVRMIFVINSSSRKSSEGEEENLEPIHREDTKACQNVYVFIT